MPIFRYFATENESKEQILKIVIQENIPEKTKRFEINIEGVHNASEITDQSNQPQDIF